MVGLSQPEIIAGRSAIVTGGGSGIGAALTRALVGAGAHVVCADLNLTAAEQVAVSTTGPGTVRAVTLDVTDAAAVASLVAQVADEHGRLDLLFNNAGIHFGGDTELLTLEHWNAIIDVNIRGVVHGVHAAYPLMLAQEPDENGRRGYLINTASMGGLMAAGQLTSYVTTKHAVVGLSLALRSEAAVHGIGVTAICPSAVDTPMLDSGEIGDFNARDYSLKGQGVRHPLPPDVLAAQVLEAIADNRPLLVTPRTARIAWRLGRLAPNFVAKSSIRFVAKQRKFQAKRVAKAAKASGRRSG